MINIKLVECKVFVDKLHVNSVCSNKYQRCWKYAFPKDYLKTRIKLLESKNMIIENKQLLGDGNEIK